MAVVFAIGTNTTVTGLYVLGTGSRVTNNNVRDLVFAGTGKSMGIDVYGIDMTIADNQVSSASPSPGIGVYGVAGNTTCKGNVISRFALGISSCIDAGGNSSH